MGVAPTQPRSRVMLWGGGRGVMEALPRVFDMLHYFETVLPSVESL